MSEEGSAQSERAAQATKQVCIHRAAKGEDLKSVLTLVSVQHAFLLSRQRRWRLALDCASRTSLHIRRPQTFILEASGRTVCFTRALVAFYRLPVHVFRDCPGTYPATFWRMPDDFLTLPDNNVTTHSNALSEATRLQMKNLLPVSFSEL